MHALLLIAHGSRREASNEDVRQLAEQIRQLDRQLDRGTFDAVVPAFLELADPDIGAGVDQCVAAGANLITVMPYFLSPGRHVAEDIPEELEHAQSRYPGVRFHLCEHLGGLEVMGKMVLDAAAAAVQTPEVQRHAA